MCKIRVGLHRHVAKIATTYIFIINNNNNNNNSLYLNTVKTDGSCTANVAVYYNTKQYSTIQYNI